MDLAGWERGIERKSFSSCSAGRGWKPRIGHRKEALGTEDCDFTRNVAGDRGTDLGNDIIFEFQNCGGIVVDA